MYFEATVIRQLEVGCSRIISIFKIKSLDICENCRVWLFKQAFKLFARSNRKMEALKAVFSSLSGLAVRHGGEEEKRWFCARDRCACAYSFICVSGGRKDPPVMWEALWMPVATAHMNGAASTSACMSGITNASPLLVWIGLCTRTSPPFTPASLWIGRGLVVDCGSQVGNPCIKIYFLCTFRKCQNYHNNVPGS